MHPAPGSDLFEPSPEGRPRAWIDPAGHERHADHTIAPALDVQRARGLT